MPTDGTDFARRRPLYGRFYVAFKNGADSAQLAAFASDGVAKEIGQRPLIAFKPAVEAVVSIANSTLLSCDAKRSLLAQQMEVLKTQLAESSPSARDVCDCVLRTGLEALDDGGPISGPEVAASAMKELVGAWCLDTINDKISRERPLIDRAVLPYAEKMANALLQSDNGKLPRNWRKSETTPISHAAEALNSEVLSPINPDATDF